MQNRNRPFQIGEVVRLTSNEQFQPLPPIGAQWSYFPDAEIPALPEGAVFWKPNGLVPLSELGFNLGQLQTRYPRRKTHRRWSQIQQEDPVARLISIVLPALKWSGKRAPGIANAANILSHRKQRRHCGFHLGGDSFLSIERFLEKPARFPEGLGVIYRAADIGVPALMVCRLNAEFTRGMESMRYLRALVFAEQQVVPRAESLRLTLAG